MALLQVKLENGEITSDLRKVNREIELFFQYNIYD